MERSHITVVFSSELTHALSEHRLPPLYVGVRRIRPSATVVAARQSFERTSSKVAFTVKDTETGIERRMTRQEKKELKLKLRHEQHLEKKQRQEQQRQEEAALHAEADARSKKRKRSMPDFLKGDHLYQLPVNPAALEQEWADLVGERNKVPPVAIAPPMSRLLWEPPLPVIVDDDLAQSWAFALKQSMQAAEQVRQAEDMRAMVYDVVPAVWSRMRPEMQGKNDETIRLPFQKENATLSTFPLRDASSADLERAAVIQALHAGTSLHVSCGAKFGSDYLLYEAPRDECHAFAGLRVLSSHCPTAYDMTGYVRCLNTAAKLALLAQVEPRSEQGTVVYHVAFVELALIKIGSTKR
ncbi:hypothetical protein FisN_16Hh046 [Fistulifera solaris]|jgi:hypothetical protein|uniref:tRNA-intron lyase n=1 Tax=Fistulifera solaris TaxID=1519565 RepID=A0A1Z5K6Q0_FISSO|nr:hypothetical protein FisN_16Hh046 [Fistulifera solaris]|eukprot:GAX21963.1 hypothetical protein FisN_16Hh046 [Fistulifera solaris]